jgi:hypothetical protein
VAFCLRFRRVLLAEAHAQRDAHGTVRLLGLAIEQFENRQKSFFHGFGCD